MGRHITPSPWMLIGSQEIEPRRGNSALYSSIRYLGEDTDWDTKLVGWTGEVNPKIRRPWERKKWPSAATAPDGVANGQLDDLDDPWIKQRPQDENSSQLVSLFKADKTQYEQTVNGMEKGKNGKKVELIPIWTLEDADRKPKGEVAESTETQERFRKYPEQGPFPMSIFLTKSVLWPLLHYVLWVETDGRQEIKWWDDYVKFNQKFCQKIVEIYKPGDISNATLF